MILNFAGGTVEVRVADKAELIESAKSWIRVARDASRNPDDVSANAREIEYALEHALRALQEAS